MNEFMPVLTPIPPRPRRVAPQAATPTPAAAKAESTQVPAPEVQQVVVAEVPEAAPG